MDIEGKEISRKQLYDEIWELSLAVQKANPAARLYERVGFRTIRETDEEFIMICDLTMMNYKGLFPDPEEIRDASNNGIIDAICEYAYELGKRDWHYIWFKLFVPYTHKCPICSNRPEGKRYGSNCICVPFACWHHGGHIPCRCNTLVINDSNWNRIKELQDHEDSLEVARKRIGVRDIIIIKGDPVMTSLLRKGDICAHFSGGKYIHSSLYLGDGKMLDCSLEKMHIAIRDTMDCVFAIRYTGGRDCLTPGDSGVAVKKVQEFLNWYFSGHDSRPSLETDGKFDRLTKEAVKLFQSQNNLEADGVIGSHTLAAMRMTSNCFQ
ncbi:MAG: peptidoglycan-binding protein [Clostridiales bacterium]|nr:peptidoglycan-binding protein [Clostridiales bacterium]